MDAYNKVIDFKSVDADYASYQKQFVTDLYLKMIKDRRVKCIP
jgi:hypothetical protein